MYHIQFWFRGNEVKAQVHDFGEYAPVRFTDKAVINDFTGTLTFEGKKYVPGFIRNKDAKDLPDLLKLMEKQLQ